MERRELSEDCFVDYDPAWLAEDRARALHAELVRELGWEARDIVLFGKRIPQPRLIAWAGDLGYRYSGQTLEPRPWGPALREILDRLVRDTETRFNHVLVNRYRDGKDSMGLHADAEPELGKRPVVATVSCGAARRFVIVPRRGSSPKVAYMLAPGSLLLMRGACQEKYRHGVPKDAAVHEERVSLTFRRLLGPPIP